MQTGTPEAYLATLVRRLKTVDAATTYLEEDTRSSFRDDLRRALRDCQMTGLLHDHTVIAIAGDQGAGKTRLMRLLYDLDTVWLGDNAGRGEYLPVLVLEDPSISEVHGCIYRWNDETNPGEPRGELVSAERFQQAVRNWTGDRLELPVLRVPMRYFGGQKNQGFLLLPGYEKITARNRPWQDFMRLALVASTACILVTNGGLLAQQQDAIRTDLQKNQLAGVQPVIAITGTEKMPADRQEQLRATAAERFQVPLNGVICTGIGDQEYEEGVRRSILGALSRQGGVGMGARQRQLEDLEELSLQIGTVVSDARQAVRSGRNTQSENEEMRLEIMETLEAAIEAARGDYKRSLEQKLDNVQRQALAIARSDFNETETGWGARLRDVRDFAVLQSSRAEDRMYTRLQSAIVQSGGGPAFAPTHAALLADLSRQQLVLPVSSESLITPTAEDARTAANVTVDGQLPTSTGVQRSLKALQGILSDRRDRDSAPLGGQDAKELKQAVRLLPPIATSYMSLIQSAVVASTQLGDMPTTDLREILQEITHTTVEMHGLTKPLLKAAAGVLAIDVAMDGEIDTIPVFINAIMAVLQGPGTTMGSPAIVSAGPVGMALGAAVLAYGVISSLEKQQTKGRAHVSEAICSALREQKTQHLAHFDEMMSWVKRRVSDQLEIVLGLDESLGNRFRAALAIDDLRNAQTSFLDEMRGRHG